MRHFYLELRLYWSVKLGLEIWKAKRHVYIIQEKKYLTKFPCWVTKKPSKLSNQFSKWLVTKLGNLVHYEHLKKPICFCLFHLSRSCRRGEPMISSYLGVCVFSRVCFLFFLIFTYLHRSWIDFSELTFIQKAMQGTLMWSHYLGKILSNSCVT
jgi:hypothetical protein